LHCCCPTLYHGRCGGRPAPAAATGTGRPARRRSHNWPRYGQFVQLNDVTFTQVRFHINYTYCICMV
jgi:hypothetical protein